MKDGEIKKTGNSRFMRSLNMPDTYEEFKALLESGIFPFDLNGINPDGWKTIPDWLNKANLLSDATASYIDGLVDAELPTTPNQALHELAEAISSNRNLTNTKAKFEIGSYKGTNTYGEDNPTSLAYPSWAKMMIFLCYGFYDYSYSNDYYGFDYSTFIPITLLESHSNTYINVGKIARDYEDDFHFKVKNNIIYWYVTSSYPSAERQLNRNCYEYYYAFLG